MATKLKPIDTRQSAARSDQGESASDVWTEPITEALRNLKKVKIRLLAIDFDQTILDIHTGGRWQGNYEDLIPHVRPLFAHLIPAAIEEGFHVAIVTFSTQVELIQYLLAEVILNGDYRLAESIPIRGGFGNGGIGGGGGAGGGIGGGGGSHTSWVYHGQGSREGKQAHMASVAEELEQTRDAHDITKATTLLVDDDGKNIRVALKNGVRAIWLNPQRSSRLLKDMAELI